MEVKQYLIDIKSNSMSTKLDKYKRYIFMGIIIITLGIGFCTTLEDATGSLGTIFIAIGGLFFIIGMSLKRKGEKEENK